jgi:hypothetical protein
MLRLVVSLLTVAAAAAFTPITRWTRPSTRVMGEYEMGEVVYKNDPILPSLDELCDLSEEEKCKQYSARMEELEGLMKDAKTVNEKIQDRIAQIENLKLNNVPEPYKVPESDKVITGSLDDECVLSSSQKCIDYQKALDQLQAEIAKVQQEA